MTAYLLKILLLIISSSLLLVWLRLLLNTDSAMSNFGLSADHKNGKSVVRSNLGAVYLTVFIMTALFLSQSLYWAYPLLIIVFAIILGRLISFYLDGYSRLMIYAVAVEAASGVILILFTTGTVNY